MAAPFATPPIPATRTPAMLALRAVLGAIAALAISLTFAGIPARCRALHCFLSSGEWFYEWAFILVVEVGLACFFFAVALFVAIKLPRDPVALFLALTLVLLGAVETSMTDALINAEWSTVAVVWRWPVLALRALEMICALTMLYVFPDGRFTPRWTRPLAVVWALANIAWLLFPDLPFNTIYGPTWRATPLASLLVGTGWFSTGIVALVIRYLRSVDDVQRQQTWWVAVGMIAAVVGGLLYYGLSAFTDSGLIPQYSWYLASRTLLQAIGMGLLPVCLAVAVLRYQLFDLDMVVNRALVHGALTITVIATYISLVTAFGALFHSANDLIGSLIATGLIAVGFQSVRIRLQRLVDRLMYGKRDDPYMVIAELGRRLDAPLSPLQLLPLIAETVASALKLPYVGIEQTQAATPEEAQSPVLLAAYGARTHSPSARLIRFPMIYQGETVGHLLAALRQGELGFRRGEQQLLNDLARQTGFVLHTIALTADVQRSRQQIVIAREEERLRMRRDLHDGMGPTLASITQRIGLVAMLIPHNPARSVVLLGELEAQVRAVISDIRQLVYALRPPTLDQYGLVEALRLDAERIALGTCTVTCVAADLPALPAAVEIAAYRIVLEAVTNVVRHAAAQHCTIELLLETSRVRGAASDETRLLLRIQDDGCGIAARGTIGVGMHSMRERAEEIGGAFAVATQPGRGTTISAALPLGEVCA
ncbi:hypothetical protein EKD04_002180 [Chloroflexales bacterium ZM16-3]|nr:hypothetical protein [Chloroflexales bacterium ZM16-3]